MKKKFLIICLIIIITLFFNISKTYAGRGCCSWHGGQAYCDTSTGRWVCNDGTYSPSCRCSSEELTDGTTDSNNDNDIMTYKEYMEQQEQVDNENVSDDNATFWGVVAISFLVFAYSPLIYEGIKELILKKKNNNT